MPFHPSIQPAKVYRHSLIELLSCAHYLLRSRRCPTLCPPSARRCHRRQRRGPSSWPSSCAWRSCPWPSSRGRRACAPAARRAPGRSTWPAPPCRARATESREKRRRSEWPWPRVLTGVVALLAPPLLLLEAEAVVVAGVPVRVHLHVELPRRARLLVILGLLLARQAVPLKRGRKADCKARISSRFALVSGRPRQISDYPILSKYGNCSLPSQPTSNEK